MEPETTNTCPHCGASLIGRMRYCAACGKQARGKPAAVPRDGNNTTLLVVLLLIILGGCAGIMSLRGSQPSPPSPLGAWVDCKDFVTRNLKAPASAAFPLSNDPSVHIGQAGGLWSVVGYVDAQNSFGAQLRQSFTCQISYSGTTATLHKLTLGGHVLLDG